jgi:hypothetical protein
MGASTPAHLPTDTRRLNLALGSILIGWLNDRVFGNPRAVGSSLAIVTCGAGILAVCLLGIGCRLFRERMMARTDNRASV